MKLWKMICKPNWEKIGLFAGGNLFGTAGIKVLTSKDAKKVYTAAVLRAKECVMTTVTAARENCDDILAEAKDINEKRAVAANAVIEDEAEETTATAEAAEAADAE